MGTPAIRGGTSSSVRKRRFGRRPKTKVKAALAQTNKRQALKYKQKCGEVPYPLKALATMNTSRLGRWLVSPSDPAVSIQISYPTQLHQAPSPTPRIVVRVASPPQAQPLLTLSSGCCARDHRPVREVLRSQAQNERSVESEFLHAALYHTPRALQAPSYPPGAKGLHPQERIYTATNV